MKIFPCALALVMCAGTAQAQDHSAEAVASAILNGFLARDVAAIAPHSNATNEDFFAEVLAGTTPASELFEGWRGDAGTSWNGMILPARYVDPDTAVIPFAVETETGSAPLGTPPGTDLIAVILTLDGAGDSTWGLEDFNFVDLDRYLGMAESR